ncbi:hypothetical protein B0H10DRAFT_2220974 [Mycena sp. CBHHK59/15]|nr:hypothetical protein B0H10DRAFT_2220974 [Mycena sp. CBHHK59/15]
MEASRLIWALAPAPCPRPSQTSGSLKNPALHTPQPIALQRKHAPTHRHREASAHPMRSTYPMLRPIFPLSGTTTRPRPIARSCFREGGDASTSCPLLMAHGWAGCLDTDVLLSVCIFPHCLGRPLDTGAQRAPSGVLHESTCRAPSSASHPRRIGGARPTRDHRGAVPAVEA